MKTYIANLTWVLAIVTFCFTLTSYGQYSVNIDGVQFKSDTEVKFINENIYAKRIIIKFHTHIFEHDTGFDEVRITENNEAFTNHSEINEFVNFLNENKADYFVKVYPQSIRDDVIRKHVVTGEKVEISDVSTIYYIYFKDFINVDNISKILREFDFVEFAEGPELIISTSSYEPNDNYLNDQWGIEVADLAKAWGIMRNGQRIGVAVSDRDEYDDLDTLIYHEDLQRLENGGNFIDIDSTDNMIRPDNHGTMVSGVFGATADNDKGIAGVAHNTAKIYSYYRGKTALRGILNDINNYNLDIRIINCSWHGYNHGDYANVIKDAMQLGIIVVAGAGNDSDNVVFIPRTVYPAGYDFTDIGLDRVIGVSATWINPQTQDEEFYSEYNFSVDDIISNPENAHIDITAPGRDILTTNLVTKGYHHHGGTSLSSPFVVGVISLILSVNENLNSSDVYDIITKTTDHVSVPDTATFFHNPSDPTDDREWNRFTGFGRVNAYQALIHTIENYGVITSTDITIPADTELNLNEDLIVQDGGSLTIEEGVTINFMDDNLKIEVRDDGELLIDGAFNNRVAINGQNVSFWGNANAIIANHGATIRFADLDKVTLDISGDGSLGVNADIMWVHFTDATHHAMLLDNLHYAKLDRNYVESTQNSGDGLRLFNVQGVEMYRNTIEQARYGIYASNSEIEHFYRNVVEDNNLRGIALWSGSEGYLVEDYHDDEEGRNRIKNNEYSEIYVSSSSTAFLGDTWRLGRNTVYNPTEYRIIINYNSSHTVSAQHTYWGSSGGADGSWFEGSVDYSNHTHTDWTGTSGSPLAKTTVPEEERKELLLELIEALDEDPYRTGHDQRLTKLYINMRMDREDEMGLREQILSTIGEWSGKRNRISSTYGDDEQVRRAMETAMLLEIRLAFRDSDYQRAKELNDAYSAYIQTTENVTAVLKNEMSIRMYHRDYAGALELLNQIGEQSKNEPYYHEDGLASMESHLTQRLGQAGEGNVPGKLADDSMRPGASPEETPGSFALEANYPNPFNPVTVIPFSVPEQSHVRLEVYDILGRRVAVLADRTFETGRHETSWDASQVTSGLYIVRMSVTTEDGQQSRYNRTMSLVK